MTILPFEDPDLESSWQKEELVLHAFEDLESFRLVESMESVRIGKKGEMEFMRIADGTLFLAPMIYELVWNWDDFELLAQGTLPGHLLECGCQLTGGYSVHPGDKHRDMSYSCLRHLSLPYAEVSSDGQVMVAKAKSSGGVLNFSTCAQQLLYEVGDPAAYITPDVVGLCLPCLSSCRG